MPAVVTAYRGSTSPIEVMLDPVHQSTGEREESQTECKTNPNAGVLMIEMS